MQGTGSQNIPSHLPGNLRNNQWLDRRRAGILLHPTSLPDSDLGPDAFRFIDFMAACGMTVWQMLPLGPTHDDGSPYQCLSAHAGNPRLISLELLVQSGWLPPGSAALEPTDPAAHRNSCLAQAYQGFKQHASAEDHAAFVLLHDLHGVEPDKKSPGGDQ